jgi:hypothetical protein
MEAYEKETTVKNLTADEILYEMEAWSKLRAPTSFTVTITDDNPSPAHFPTPYVGRRFNATFKNLELGVS